MAASTSQATAETHNAVRKGIGRDRSSGPVFDAPKRILVACHEIVLTGGLLRFDRVAAVLRGWGHDLSFVTLADTPRLHRPTDVSVLSFEAALQTRWDAVVLAGAWRPPLPRVNHYRSKVVQVRICTDHSLVDRTSSTLNRAKSRLDNDRS